LSKYLNACDTLVLPSIQRTEAFGIVLLEAMACGKPVVTTELGTGTSYACQDGVTGYVVPPKNPKAMQDAINKILLNEDLKKSLGEAARPEYRRHSDIYSRYDVTELLKSSLFSQCLIEPLVT